jgi:hypothetical protein
MRRLRLSILLAGLAVLATVASAAAPNGGLSYCMCRGEVVEQKKRAVHLPLPASGYCGCNAECQCVKCKQ